MRDKLSAAAVIAVVAMVFLLSMPNAYTQSPDVTVTINDQLINTPPLILPDHFLYQFKTNFFEKVMVMVKGEEYRTTIIIIRLREANAMLAKGNSAMAKTSFDSATSELNNYIRYVKNTSTTAGDLEKALVARQKLVGIENAINIINYKYISTTMPDDSRHGLNIALSHLRIAKKDVEEQVKINEGKLPAQVKQDVSRRATIKLYGEVR